MAHTVRLLAETDSIAAIGTAPDGTITLFSRGAELMLGYQADELVGRQTTAIFHEPAEIDRVAAELGVEPGPRVLDPRVAGDTRPRDWTYRRRDGSTLTVSLSVSAIQDEVGSLQGYVALVQDVTHIREAELARRHVEAQLRHLANHDALTGVYNRVGFETELERELTHARLTGQDGALMILDLDGFKFINDRYGHAVGGQLVALIAGVLGEHVGEDDVIARLGGDEFAIIVPDCGLQDAVLLAERVLEAVRLQSVAGVRRGDAQVTTSIGITTFGTRSRSNPAELVVEADIAMYDAKAAGRNGYVVYTAASLRRAEHNQPDSWFSRLRRALDEDRFVLYAQPIVPLGVSGCAGYELLLRMVDDAGVLVSPGAFLFNAERFELIGEIDRWVLREAAKLLHQHDAAGRSVIFSVNLSGKTMNDLNLVDDLAAILREYPVPPGRLVVEVTETAAIVNVERARELADQLRALGCQFALDDFGAGWASFFYLKHLEFDYLKIDGEFIVKLVDNEIDQLVVRALVEIARGLGVRTVAEFVGDDRTVELLRRLGVDYGQGFHLGAPGPIEAVVGAPALQKPRTAWPFLPTY